MKFDLSFWRFVIHLNLATTWTWGKNVGSYKEEVYWIHIGTISKDGQTVLKLIILPISFMIGFVKYK